MQPRLAHRLAVIGIAAAHFAAGLIFLTPAWIRPDSVMEYAFLRSALLDRDFLFFNEWAHFGMIRDGITMTKEVNALSILVNHGWVGTSLLAAPQYALALLFAPQDGFSGLAAAVLAWTTVIEAITVSIVIFLIIGRVAPRLDVVWRLVIVGTISLGTPFFWYEYRFPLGTHVAAALCIALLTLSLLRLVDGEEVSFALIGILLGLAIVTRLQHVVLAPAVGLALLGARRPAVAFRTAIAASMLPGSIQAVVWWITYGHPLGPLVAGANAGGSTWSPFRELAIFPVLFSSYHGLFTWAPVTLLAVVGLVIGLRGAKTRFATILMMMFVGELIANSAFDRFWWGGMSFGPRRFVDLVVVFAIGLGWLVEAACASKIGRIATAAAIIVATAWTCLLTSAALQRQLDLSRDVTSDSLISSSISGLALPPVSELRSTITDAEFFRASAGAIVLLAVAFAVFVAAARSRAAIYFLSAYLLLALVFSASLWSRTRSRAADEAASHGIDVARASRMGPLLDQRNLLRAEFAYYSDRGRTADAAATARDLSTVDSLIQSLGGFERSR